MFKPGWECIGPRFVRDGKNIVQIYSTDGSVNTSVTGISVESTQVATASGVRLGDPAGKVARTYPKLARRPAYTALQSGQKRDVHELVDGRYSLFFEVDTEVGHISVQAAKTFSPMGTAGVCGAP